jgi:hypothetical protein
MLRVVKERCIAAGLSKVFCKTIDSAAEFWT